MRLIKGNLYDICRIRICKDFKRKKLTDSILNEKNNCIFITILEDKNGSISHGVGVNIGIRLIMIVWNRNHLC